MRIVVSIPPLAWAVRGLAPDDAEIEVLMTPGISPHTFEMTPMQAAAIDQADLVVLVGLGLEPRVEAAIKRRERPERKVLRLGNVIPTEELIVYSGHDHGHSHAHDHDEHHHDHSGDPHLWLDPRLMKPFIIELDRVMHADDDIELPSEDAEALLTQCDAVDAAYESALAGIENRTIVTHHNAYSYLARRYDLKVAAVIQPIEASEPTPGDIVGAVEAIRSEGVEAIFIEPQFPAKAARRIGESTGVKILTLDPLGEGDWPKMMRENLKSLVEGLGGSDDAGDSSSDPPTS